MDETAETEFHFEGAVRLPSGIDACDSDERGDDDDGIEDYDSDERGDEDDESMEPFEIDTMFNRSHSRKKKTFTRPSKSDPHHSGIKVSKLCHSL